MLSNLMVQIGFSSDAEINENMVRHMVLNTIRSLNVKFRKDYGELVIACDAQDCWRKEKFPYYKANRKRNVLKSKLDWTGIFAVMNNIREELKAFTPYRVIHIHTAEADDIIATLIQTSKSKSPTLIISGDKDFIQLHRFPNVKQYDPTRKKFLSNANPERFLKEHVIKGDVGDGVPNILSPDNCLVIGQRQKVMTAGRLSSLMKTAPYDYDEDTRRNYQRNETVIDLLQIPVSLADAILESYNEQGDKDSSLLMDYFAKHRLRSLFETVGDF